MSHKPGPTDSSALTAAKRTRTSRHPLRELAFVSTPPRPIGTAADRPAVLTAVLLNLSGAAATRAASSYTGFDKRPAQFSDSRRVSPPPGERERNNPCWRSGRAEQKTHLPDTARSATELSSSFLHR